MTDDRTPSETRTEDLDSPEATIEPTSETGVEPTPEPATAASDESEDAVAAVVSDDSAEAGTDEADADTDSAEGAEQDTGSETGVAAGEWDGEIEPDPDSMFAATADGMTVDLDAGEYSDEEYEAMLAMYEDTLHDIVEGEIVKATVLRKTDNAVILDVGFKSEGSVPLDEFRDPDALETGDEVEVFLESLEDSEGVVVLSKKKADFLRVWEKIKDAYDNDRPVPGVLKRKIKGGVTVDLMGVDAFLPGSQIALRRVPNVDDLIGNEYDFMILKLNKRRRNIVVSRRVILEAERADKRELLKKELEVGQVRKGVVKNITDFGAFIDLGGMDGLLHITDMSWGRIGHPSEITNIGEELEVKILDIDWDRERISLGLKQLMAYPWEDVAAKYPVGSRVRGRVVSITNYGAFIELEKGVEGLVHISEMSWTRNVRHPSQLVSIGDEIQCVVLRVDEEEKKISLGMKQTEEDPWLALPAKYPPGTKIKGVVRNLTSFGGFVEVEPGIDGLVHISDMSWTRRVQHPSEVVKKGEEVEVVVLNIDPDQKRISLGLKQVEDDPWYELAKEYEPDSEWSGTIVRLLDKGVVVDLGKEIEGFVPISQLGVEEELEDPSERFMEGDPLELKVIESDPINRRIVLAVTAIPERPERPMAEESEDVEAETGSEADVEVEAEAVEVEAEAEEVEAEAEEADATETEAVGEDGAGEVEEGVAESEEDSGTVEGDEEVEKEKDS
ncbi:MAG: 30S ribosomal protein S1 [marine benthic group bacterium]|nr:30S ribosomal protein S1 [Gemmatimonadota bacterium]